MDILKHAYRTTVGLAIVIAALVLGIVVVKIATTFPQLFAIVAAIGLGWCVGLVWEKLRS